MTGSLALAAILVAAPIGLFLLHAVVCRLMRFCGYGSAMAPQMAFFVAAAVGNILVAYLAWEMALKNMPGDSLQVFFGFAYVLATYNACCYGYFNVVNMSETSLHVNILMRLLVGGGTPPQELARMYGVEDMINARIDRMTALGQLKEKEGRYFLGNRTLVLVGRVINAWRSVLGLPGPE